MKSKSWSKYFFTIILILVIAFGGQYVLNGIIRNAKQNLNYNVYYHNIMMIIFYGAIGRVLGLDHLIKETKKEGPWVINISKLIFMGIPSLYFSLAICIVYINNQFIQNVIAYPIRILSSNSTNFISIFQLILGYSIIISFNKKMNKCDNT